MKICTIPIGYADGLRRVLSDKIDFIMDGRYYRQVGAICMDQSMFEIDLRNRKNLAFDPQVGDHVIVVGEQGAAAPRRREPFPTRYSRVSRSGWLRCIDSGKVFWSAKKATVRGMR